MFQEVSGGFFFFEILEPFSEALGESQRPTIKLLFAVMEMKNLFFLFHVIIYKPEQLFVKMNSIKLA